MYPGILFGLLDGIVLEVCPLLVLSFRDSKNVFLQDDTPWTERKWDEVLDRTGKGPGNQGARQQPVANQAPAGATPTGEESIGITVIPIAADGQEKIKGMTSVTVVDQGPHPERSR